MKRYFYLARNINEKKYKSIVDDLNHKLGCAGVHFIIEQSEHEYQGRMYTDNKLVIDINEEKLNAATLVSKAGRPVKHNIDFKLIEKMKSEGKTNKEIYTELGISKSLFYLKMKEYKNNNGHENYR